MKKFISKILLFAILFNFYCIDFGFLEKKAYATDFNAPSANIDRKNSKWTERRTSESVSNVQLTHKLSYTTQGASHTLEVTYNARGGEYYINPFDRSWPERAYDLPGENLDRTGKLYNMTNDYVLDGQKKSFGNTNDKANYSILVLNPDQTATETYVVKILTFVGTEGEKPIIMRHDSDFELSEKINSDPFNKAVYALKDSYYWNVAKGGLEGILGPYIMWMNKNILPQSLDNRVAKVPEVCKKLIIDPVSKDNFAELDALAEKVLGPGEKSPFKDENKDLQNYRKYYMSQGSTYPDRHIDYANFLQEYQSGEDALSTEITWFEDEKLPPDWMRTTDFIYNSAMNWMDSPPKVAIEAGVAAKVVPGLATVVVGTGAKTVQGVAKMGGAIGKFWAAAAPGAETFTAEQIAANIAAVGGTGATNAAVATGAGVATGTEATSVLAVGSAGLLAAVGVIAVGAVILGVNGYKEWVNKDMMAKRFELITVQMYMLHHLQFHKCMVKNGATDGGFTQENLDQETKDLQAAGGLLNKLFTKMDAANKYATGGDCPASKVLDPKTWFSSSLCGLGMALYEAGQRLIDFAKDQLMVVLGLTNGSKRAGKTGY